MAEAELVEDMMRVVIMSWKHEEWGLLDREIVGEEVARETARWALAETGPLLIDGQSANQDEMLNRTCGIDEAFLTFLLSCSQTAFSCKSKDVV